MVPVDAWRAERPGLDVAGLAGTSPEADIDELIDLTLDTKRRGIAVVEDGAVVGVVTPRSLLLGVKGAHDLRSRAALRRSEMDTSDIADAFDAAIDDGADLGQRQRRVPVRLGPRRASRASTTASSGC